MTPLYNGNEYYKKMLELQERLRKSEEERIRLEERFSLLEHESRSRHETCISRLRMRYIDFLEQQQARDERNHQLLGALDRVDISLAQMTAKTDRLGALRKQYEASILARHENRRLNRNGSVTGDSGVASQNDEGHRRCVELYRGNGNVDLAPSRNRSIGNKGRSNRTSNSASQVRPGSSYGSNWAGMRCESSQMHPSSFAFSRLSQGVKSHALNRDNELSAGFNSPELPARFLNAKTSSDPRYLMFQSLRYGNANPPASSNLDYRKNDLPHYQESDYASRRLNTDLGQNLKYGRSVVRDLAASGAYDSVEPAPKSYNSAPAHFRDTYEQTSINRNSPRNNNANISHRNSNSPDSSRNSNLENHKIRSSSSRSPKLCDILRQELGDEEEHIGHIVENQLERYISKIRSLHRVAETQSLEEIDHEENTSGDLLNVTLSDDGLDLPVEDKPRDRLLRQDLGNVLALASDLANQTASNAFNVANNMYQNISPGDEIEGTDAKVALNHERNKSDVPVAVSEAGHQLASINRLADQTESHKNENVSHYEEHESLAKNGISGNIVKSHSELASWPTRNIRDIAKLTRSGEDSDQGECASGIIGANPVNENGSTLFNTQIISQAPEDKLDKFSRRSSSLHLLEESRYKLMSGEERENDENLHDVVVDLEPWNLSALERRVQEIILNDEAQDDFVRRGTGGEVDDASKRFEHEQELGGIEEEIVEPEANEQTIDDSIVENAFDPDDSWKNIEDGQDGAKSRDDSRLEENQQSLSNPLEGSKNELLETDAVSYQKEPVEGINYSSVNDGADSNDNYEQNQANADYKNHKNGSYDQEGYPDNSTVDYAYNADGSYQVPDEQYPQYSTNDGVQYEENQGQQYGYAGEQYVQDSNKQNYVQDPDQQTYVENSNEDNYVQDVNQQNYVQDPNEQDYVQDPNQQDFVQDPNQQSYVQDPNQQDYVQDPNQQDYVQDPNQQSYVQDSNQQDYVQDPNQQDYVQDPNQQSYVQDPNQQEWVQDPNQQYDGDVHQQFVQDPNQEYLDNADQQYSALPEQLIPTDSNKQYLADQQYSAQSNEQYSGQDDSVQPYLNTGEYLQGENQEYPVPSTHHPYPESEGYSNDEGYFRAVQEDPTVPYEENLQQSPERSTSLEISNNSPQGEATMKKTKDVIKAILDSDTDSTIEKNVSNTESDFDFN